jgi:hypothetical protein
MPLVVCAFAVSATFLTSALRAQDSSAPPTKSEKKADAESGDEYDKLYELRIQYFGKTIAIYESVVDEASAEKAAKKWRALLPLETEIKELDKKLGPPSAERQAELNEQYVTKINKLAVKSAQQTLRLANKPYYNKIHIAQLQNAADQGDEDAEKALSIMLDPEAMAAYEAEQKAAEAKRKAAIKTDPAAERAVKAYIEITKELRLHLDGVTDGASAKAAAPKALELVKKWEARQKALDALGPPAGNSVIKHQAELKATMGALWKAWFTLMNNKDVSQPLKDVLEKIGKSWADV